MFSIFTIQVSSYILREHAIKNEAKETYSIVRKRHKINQNSPMEITVPGLAQGDVPRVVNIPFKYYVLFLYLQL